MTGLKYIRSLPHPGDFPLKIADNLKVLLLSEATNSLTRRVENELLKYKITVTKVEARTTEEIQKATDAREADLVICPFLKAKVPDQLMSSKKPVLIVHPGIAGDRGASSLDWAILERKSRWGVTVLEASPVMDGGPIWSTDEFNILPDATKTGLYNGQVSDAAVQCVVDAVSRFSQHWQPVAQDGHPELKGQLKRNMKHADRVILWTKSAEDVCRQIRMSDTVPGAIGELTRGNATIKSRLFDCRLETGEYSQNIQNLLEKSFPGEMVARKHKSVLVRTGDGLGVWIGQMKQTGKVPAMKLPFTDGVPNTLKLPCVTDSCACDDISILQTGPICYVNFDFYNGAMDVGQATRLRKALEHIEKNPDVKVVALMGGDRFFSTGIHLCAIENSPVKQLEAWANINAIDDVIKVLVNMKNKASVAVLRGNAGAGGAMLAAACDVAISHPGVLLTPSYKTMNLYGSEYWTYFLPKRVGHNMATKLVRDSNPISADYAQSIGLLDHILGEDKVSFLHEIPDFLNRIEKNGEVTDIIREKNATRDSDWRHLIQRHRQYELEQMAKCFQSNAFLTSMHNFVYKLA